MTDQEQQTPRKLKKKAKQAEKTGPEVNFELEEAFNPANAKDKDFDLNLKDMNFQAKKGQAGTRYKGTGDDNLERTVDPRSG